MSPDIVVTSMSMSTSVAGDIDAGWKSLLNGESGIDVLDEDWLIEYDLPVRIGGRLAVSPTRFLSRVEIRRMSLAMQLAVVLGRELWRNAGTPEIDPRRLGVCVGTSLGGLDALTRAADALRTGGKVTPLAVTLSMANGPSTAVGLELRAGAGVTAAVSGAEAIAAAWRMIAFGDADAVVAGGVDLPIDPVPFAAFSNLRTLSRRNHDPRAASRPFDRDRDGLVLGEAGAMMMLESEDHALARGATIHGRLLGIGVTADTHHLVAPDPQGRGLSRAMTRAIETSGLVPGDIHHVNAAAAGTRIGDPSEALAILQALGNTHPPVYAPKSALGHTLGAAGAVEAVLTVLSIRDSIIPPTLNLEHPDVDLDIVHGDARRGAIDYALTNSVDLGGHNVSLTFGRQ
ncbi:beta-ketoacyl synthase N-terminal-like domain-containing protein [Nocardia sp. NPDC052001]|uniref:beta-ketoacyl synthase N-terminal-like domain-containing protein n=1 Tax=Nocardia sp. NPDC052001 TaxID=3154853 RepID=UPI00341C73DB